MQHKIKFLFNLTLSIYKPSIIQLTNLFISLYFFLLKAGLRHKPDNLNNYQAADFFSPALWFGKAKMKNELEK